MGIDIDIWRMVEYVINVVIIILVLSKLLYKPVSKYLKERQAKIDSALDGAAASEKDAAELKRQYEELLSQARAESAETLRKASEQAARQADEIVEAAREQSRQIIQQAHGDVEKQMKLAREQSHDQVVEMAVQMASQILGREVSRADNADIIKAYFEGQGTK